MLSALIRYVFGEVIVGIDLHLTLSITCIFDEDVAVIVVIVFFVIELSVPSDELVAVVLLLLDECFVYAFKELIAVVSKLGYSFVDDEHAKHKGHNNQNLCCKDDKHSCLGVDLGVSDRIHDFGLQ